MKKVSTALTIFISLSIFIITLGQYLPFEFSASNLKDIFYEILLFAFPISVGIKIFIIRDKKNDSTLKRVIKSIVLGFLIFIFTCVFLLGKLTCGYITDTVLFEKKSDKSIKVIARYFDCGAWDSDMQKIEYVTIDSITPFINYVSEIDTAKIDKNIWIRIHP